MLGCAALLADALVETGGIDIWLHAPVPVADALRQTAPGHVAFTVASVAVMVVLGSDYQQFIIAAHGPAAARIGCLLAAGIVFALGFLPASAVIAARSFWKLNNATDPVQVVPVLLMHALSQRTGPNFIIAALVASALGAGCAILRAMSEALAAVGPRSTWQSVWSRILPVALRFLLATRGQSLVDIMVELDMVYLAAIAPLLVLGPLRWHVSDKVANASMHAGAESQWPAICYVGQA
jgi:SSS family solute:Na+ symporter